MRSLLLIALILVVFSCKEITYPEPQPKGKKSLALVPDNLHGKFIMRGEGGDEDTLVITRNEVYDFNNPDKDRMMLGDSLVLRQYKGLYFFNKANKKKRRDWSMAIFKPISGGDFEVLLMPTDKTEFKKFSGLIGAVVSIDSTERDGEKLYQINPTPKQLMTLVKKGYFSDRILLKRMK